MFQDIPDFGSVQSVTAGLFSLDSQLSWISQEQTVGDFMQHDF